MPAPKVHRESRENFVFALVPKNFFRASRPVPKVHRESREKFFFALVPKNFFRASRPVPKVHRESKRQKTHFFIANNSQNDEIIIFPFPEYDF